MDSFRCSDRSSKTSDDVTRRTFAYAIRSPPFRSAATLRKAKLVTPATMLDNQRSLQLIKFPFWTMAKKGNVLVVDDEEVMRDVLETVLSQDGYRVDLAKTGEEGIARFGERTYDVV